jgi:hypothetical protein
LNFARAGGTVVRSRHVFLPEGDAIMRLTLVCLAGCALALAVATPASAQQLELPRASPGAKVMQTVGVTEITVDYSSPGVKGRKIWGGVVPYNQVWRAGANAATKITFSKDVQIAEKTVPAGSYAFFALPTPTKWTLILSKDANQFGAFSYKKENDFLRVDVKPQPIPMRERLAYAITNFTDTNASLDLEWERVRVSLPIRVRTEEQVAAFIKALQNNGWNPWASAARYELEKRHYEAGLQLIEKSIVLKETWLNVFVKAQLLAGRGNYKDAYPLAQKAKEMGEKDGDNFFLRDEVDSALKNWKGKI